MPELWESKISMILDNTEIIIGNSKTWLPLFIQLRTVNSTSTKLDLRLIKQQATKMFKPPPHRLQPQPIPHLHLKPGSLSSLGIKHQSSWTWPLFIQPRIATMTWARLGQTLTPLPPTVMFKPPVPQPLPPLTLQAHLRDSSEDSKEEISKRRNQLSRL